MRGALLFIVVLFASGCCIDLGGPRPSPDAGCDAGDCALSDGGASDCPPGSFRAPGEPACAPLGWTDCADGFAPSSTGWGCEEVTPVARCTGATREALGQTACVPVGDCAQPFPPSGARLFVSPSGPLDATHFHSVEQAALKARAGDVIAVDTGVYPESVGFDVPVTLVGRCAAQVVLDGATSRSPGLVVRASSTVRGVTVRGFTTGVDVGADLVLEDSVLEGNLGQGVYAEQMQGPITLSVARSVVRGTRETAGTPTFGVVLAQGTTLDLKDSALVDNQGANLLVGAQNAATVTGCFIADATPTSDGVGGYGLTVPGGTATVTRSAFVHNTDIGVRGSKGSTLTIDQVVVRATRAGTAGYGIGLASIGSTVDAKELFVTGTEGVAVASVVQGTLTLADSDLVSQSAAPDGDFGDGAYAFGGSKLTLRGVAIVDAARVGAEVFDQGSELSLERVLVEQTRLKPNGTMGIGVVVGFHAHASVTATALLSSHHSGLYAFEGGTLDVRSTLVRDVAFQTADVPLGHGALVQDSPHATFVDVEVRGAAAIGLAFSNSAAVVSAGTVADNAVGIHVQDGSSLSEVSVAPGAPSGKVVAVTSDTLFVGNASRVGVGTVPLPTPITHP